MFCFCFLAYGDEHIDEFNIVAKSLLKLNPEYKIIFDEYNFLTLSIIQHLIYVLSVISTAIFETSNFSIFNFIGKGSINYYLRIIKKNLYCFEKSNINN